MKKNVLSAVTATVLLFASQGGFAEFTPHNEPIVSQNPPRPNIMMILDDSGSMKYGENETTSEFVNKSKAPLSTPNPGEARNIVLREIVIGKSDKDKNLTGGLIDSYIDKAYMGFGVLGYGEKEAFWEFDTITDKSALFKIYPEIPESVDMMQERPLVPPSHPAETSGPENGLDKDTPSRMLAGYGLSPHYSIIQSVITEPAEPNKNDPKYDSNPGQYDADLTEYKEALERFEKDLVRFKGRVDKYTGGITTGAYQDSFFGLSKPEGTCYEPYPAAGICYEDEVHSGYVRGGTSLGPAVYNATRYYRNKPLFLGRTADFSSDVMYEKKFELQYRCQENYVLLLTDGFPTLNQMPSTTDSFNGENLILSEDKGIAVGSSNQYENMSLSRAARIAAQVDLRDPKWRTKDKDAAGKDWFSAGSKELPIKLHAIRFASEKSADAVLEEAVKHTEGIAAKADNREELELAFHRIFQAIMATKSGAGAVEDQFMTGVDTIRFASYYYSASWTGEIQAQKYDVDKKAFATNKEDGELHWSTDDTILPGQGMFITQGGAALSVENLNLTGKLEEPEKYIDWLKGYYVEELRVRPTPLGAIINSDIVYAGVDRLNINLSKLGSPIKKEFEKYLVNKVNNMPHNLLIAGSNDGLINFIIADKKSEGKAGARYYSYFPSFFQDDLETIAKKRYEHSFKVNGITSLFDAKVGDTFQSIGITAMAAGKKGLVGYQIFKVDDINNKDDTGEPAIKPLYEITNGYNGFEKLGYTYSGIEFFNRYNTTKPNIGQVGAEAIAVFGNGFGASNNSASVIYIMNAVTGKLIEEISLSSDGGGAATPAIQVETDSTGFQVLKSIYVGDYSGKLYKVSITDPLNFTVQEADIITLYTPDGSGTPITVKPMLVKDTKGKLWTYFGTGMAADINTDLGKKSKEIVHNFFAIKDMGITRTKGDLNPQKITNDPMSTVDSEGYYEIKTSSNESEKSLNGWYMPLSKLGAGVRVVRPAALTYPNPSDLTKGNIQFTTWGVDDKETADLCIGDKLIGPALYLDLFTGNSSDILGGGVSGKGKEGDALGISTGTGVKVIGSEGGASDGNTGPLSSETENAIDEKLGKDVSRPDYEECVDGFRTITHTTENGVTVTFKVNCLVDVTPVGERVYFNRLL